MSADVLRGQLHMAHLRVEKMSSQLTAQAAAIAELEAQVRAKNLELAHVAAVRQHEAIDHAAEVTRLRQQLMRLGGGEEPGAK